MYATCTLRIAPRPDGAERTGTAAGRGGPWDGLVFAMTYVERYDNARVTASQVLWDRLGSGWRGRPVHRNRMGVCLESIEELGVNLGDIVY